MTKILIVEDETALQTLLKYNLEKQGYETAAVMDGRRVMRTIADEKPDLILMDWMLPNVSGVDLCHEIRKNYDCRHLPIIMLTARGDEADKVKGLSFGADDYMTKPFSVPELMARIAALLRRVPLEQPDRQDLVFQDITMDFSQRRVVRNGREVHLGPSEFRLLQTLMEHAGDVLSREMLLKAVWGDVIHVELRTVDVYVRRLRKMLDANGEPDLIRTVRSLGYAMAVQPQKSDTD